MRSSLVNCFLALECIGWFSQYRSNSVVKGCCRLHQEPMKPPTKFNVGFKLGPLGGSYSGQFSNIIS